jgi:nucleotide-binding universal stress UspA family protein
MFKRVLLCYDGSVKGRRALRHGAELAGLVGARVYVLSVVPNVVGVVSAAHAAGCSGGVDFELGHRQLLGESVEWLKARGIAAEGFLARGDIINEIVAYAKRLTVDLIVVGHYPHAPGGRWWAGPRRLALAEQVSCSVLIAVSDAEAVQTGQSTG